PAGLTSAVEQRIWELEQARHGSGSARGHLQRGASGPDGVLHVEPPLQVCSLGVGSALGAAFLAGEAGRALSAEVAQAERLTRSLGVGLEIDEALTTLPWETLQLPASDGVPGAPIALHPRVQLHRAITDLGTTPAVTIPGPLRVLVAIGSPEAQNARG